MAATQFVFYFSEDIEERSNKFLISSLFREILDKGQEGITIRAFFSENAIYALLQLPLYFQQALARKKVQIFLNDTQASALLGTAYSKLAWLREKGAKLLDNSEFFRKYADLAALKNVRLLKF